MDRRGPAARQVSHRRSLVTSNGSVSRSRAVVSEGGRRQGVRTGAVLTQCSESAEPQAAADRVLAMLAPRPLSLAVRPRGGDEHLCDPMAAEVPALRG